jgi:hypothetical protein
VSVARILIVVDNKAALAAIQETATAVGVASDEITVSDERTVAANREATASFESMRKGVMMLGTVALAALAFGIDKSVKAAMAWQTQQASLQTALKNTGQYSAAALKGINAETEALATHGGFSVANQLPAVTQLVGATHNLTEAENLNVAATNLARGAHIAYGVAIKDVEGAAIGQGRAIQKLVGVIVPVTKFTYGWSSAMKAADEAGYQHAQTLNKLATGQEILGRVTKLFGDQTAAYSATTAGHLSNLSNGFEILGVQIGRGFLPIVNQVAQVLGTVGGWMTGHMSVVKEFGKQLFAVGGYILAIVAAVKAWTLIQAALNSELLTNPIGLALTAIGLLIIEIITHWSQFKKVGVDAWNAIKAAVQPAWKFIMDIYDAMKWIVGAAKSIAGLFSFGGATPTGAAVGLPAGQNLLQYGRGHPYTGVPSSVPATTHYAGSSNKGQAIVLHHTTMLDKRVLAEEVVHYAQGRSALK